MVASRFLIASFVAAVSASALAESDIFTTLLKRQEPGTPAYNCHDNCGTAITISKASNDVCKDCVFLYDYNNCLACAGPTNYDIWKYYGGSLSGVATKCGLSTELSTVKKDAVPNAKHPGDSISSAASQASATPTVAASSAAGTAVSSSESPEATSEAAASSVGAVPTPASSAYGTASGFPSPSSNGTATFSSSPPAQQTTNAAIKFYGPDAATMFGLVVFEAMYGLGN